MRLLRNILIGLVFLLAILAIIGMFLPRYVTVDRDIVVNAAPEAVYSNVSSLQVLSEWSPWGDFDPGMVVEFSGPEVDVGNVMAWTSENPNLGNGRQEILEVVANESLRTALDFGDMGTAEAWWRTAMAHALCGA